MKPIEKAYEEISLQVASEITKSAQILGFLGVLLLFSLNRIGDYMITWRIIFFILASLDTLLLLYTNLGKGYLGFGKTWESLLSEKDEKLLLKNVKVSYKIRKEKHLLNKITTLLTIIIFLLLLTLATFNRPA